MRYLEILEASRLAREADEQDQRRRAHEQLAASDKKRSDAARKYQDQVQSAQAAASKARAKLSSIPENTGLVEGSTSYALRDRNGVLLGSIEAVGRVLQAKDRTGTVIGWYDPRQNQTRDRTGTIVGTGDFLSALLVGKRRV
jgi:hypothetical protein